MDTGTRNIYNVAPFCPGSGPC